MAGARGKSDKNRTSGSSSDTLVQFWLSQVIGPSSPSDQVNAPKQHCPSQINVNQMGLKSYEIPDSCPGW